MSPHDQLLSDKNVTSRGQEPATVHYQAAYLLHQVDPPPDVTARLEWLDDLMFAAIDGDPVALEAASDAWKKAVNELGTDAIEESRRQYLRRAQSVWNELRHLPNHPPHKVFAAIEMISLLAGKAW
jgi:hypothetical protein